MDLQHKTGDGRSLPAMYRAVREVKDLARAGGKNLRPRAHKKTLAGPCPSPTRVTCSYESGSLPTEPKQAR